MIADMLLLESFREPKFVMGVDLKKIFKDNDIHYAVNEFHTYLLEFNPLKYRDKIVIWDEFTQKRIGVLHPTVKIIDMLRMVAFAPFNK